MARATLPNTKLWVFSSRRAISMTITLLARRWFCISPFKSTSLTRLFPNTSFEIALLIQRLNLRQLTTCISLLLFVLPAFVYSSMVSFSVFHCSTPENCPSPLRMKFTHASSVFVLSSSLASSKSNLSLLSPNVNL